MKALVALCLVVFPLIGRTSVTQNISLAGQWRFALDRSDVGVTDHWFETNLPDTIELPGALQAQGYGNPISIHTPWVLSLYDKLWYLRADYSAYTNVGDVKVPFLSQPLRHYVGAAWYQRDIRIPEDWKDRRVVLFLERPHWESRVWLDGNLIGTNDSLCAPHEYDLGVVSPGEHRISIRVDNRMILPYRPDAHSVSDSLGGSWNGIVGKMELRSTPRVWIRDLQIFPNVTNKSVRVKVRIGNDNGKPDSGTIEIHVEQEARSSGTVQAQESGPVHGSAQTGRTAHLTYSLKTNGGSAEIEIPLGPSAQTWDEFHPALYELSATLISKYGTRTTQHATFGLRDFHADGTHFILNCREVYLRGTHNGGDFPLTGYPPTDVASWKKIFQTCQSYGLNLMRFHSWCPPEAAFEAADELGFYLQPECGMWNEISPNSPMLRMLYKETDRIIQVYGNHPSFILLSASNEAHGRWQQCLPQWVEHYRAEDPRRLYTPDTGWTVINKPGPVTGADYLIAGRIGFGPLRGERGWFGRDYESSVRGVNVPVLSHEVGQWCAYPDYDIIKKFTGYLRPGNYEIYRDSMAAHGLLNMDKQFARASGRFQLECYKEEIEANLRTPDLAGFELLDLHDYIGQGTALVGLLDTFWESKGYVTPSEFREFCDTTVPLARLPSRVFTTADPFDVDVEVAHFGEGPLRDAPANWEIVNRRGETVAKGDWPAKTIPIGKNIPLGKIHVDLAQLPVPAQYKLVVKIPSGPRQQKTLTRPSGTLSHRMGEGRGEGGVSNSETEHPDKSEARATTFQNEWNFWLYPAAVSDAVPPGIFVTHSWDEARIHLASGGKVLFLPRNTDLYWNSPPLDDVPVFWNRLMNPKWSRMLGLWCDTNSAALAEFPTEANYDWQWTQIVRGVRAVNLDNLPWDVHPIVQAIDDWNRNWKLGCIFDCKVGPGRLMVSAFDLTSDLEHRPVARQLRRSLLDYMAGPDFHPSVEVTADQFQSVLFDTRIMSELGATATADGGNAAAAIDGDPNTFWIVGEPRRGASANGHPHVLTISFPKPVAMNGIVLMPRQNDRNHLGDVKDYSIEVSDEGQAWKEVARGELKSTWSPQQVKFARTVTAAKLRFTALTGFGNDTGTAIADLAVMYSGPRLEKTDSGEMQYHRSRSTSTDVDEGPAQPSHAKRNDG